MDDLVEVKKWPALSTVMWDDHRIHISRRDAWSYYDRRWRWVESAGVASDERKFQQELAAEFGSYFESEWDAQEPSYWADVDISTIGFLEFTRWLDQHNFVWMVTPVEGNPSWARVWVNTANNLLLFELQWSKYIRRTSHDRG